MMDDLLKMLLYADAGGNLNNWALLGFRVLLALELFRVHGLKKFQGQNGLPEQVPNPLHLPPALNFWIATFSDTIVPFFVIAGLGTRLVVLPVIGITAIGYGVVHRNDSLQVRDVPYMYTLCFALLLVFGAGTISMDYFLWSLLK